MTLLALIISGVPTLIYLIVVLRLSCHISSLTVVTATQDWISVVAKVCLRVCGDACILSFLAVSTTIIVIVEGWSGSGVAL